MDAESIGMQDIFVFERTGIDESGKVRGVFKATGDASAVCRAFGDEWITTTRFAFRIEDGGLNEIHASP